MIEVDMMKVARALEIMREILADRQKARQRQGKLEEIISDMDDEEYEVYLAELRKAI